MSLRFFCCCDVLGILHIWHSGVDFFSVFHHSRADLCYSLGRMHCLGAMKFDGAILVRYCVTWFCEEKPRLQKVHKSMLALVCNFANKANIGARTFATHFVCAGKPRTFASIDWGSTWEPETCPCCMMLWFTLEHIKLRLACIRFCLYI